MNHKLLLIFCLTIGLLLLAGCGTPEATPTADAYMPNPASVFCEDHGGKVELRTDETGAVTGVCVFPDGSECEEWAYYRGECAPASAEQTAAPTAAPTAGAYLPNPASVFCEDNGGKVDLRTDENGAVTGFCVFPDGSECDEWAFFRGECAPGGASPTVEPTPEVAADGCLVYRNETLGFSFHYPASTEIIPNENPKAGFSVSGTDPAAENWPQIYVSFPDDREDFRPPLGVNLEQWLSDNNLTGEKRQGDTQIGGELAIHFRHDRSPQSYADDRYFFAHNGQLYLIIFLHVGDKEDWTTYNHILDSFTFTP